MQINRQYIRPILPSGGYNFVTMDSVKNFFGSIYSSLASVQFGRLVVISLCAYGGCMLVFAVICALQPRLRASDKRPVFCFVNAFSALFFALLLIELTVAHALFYAVLFWLAGYLYYGALCAFTRPVPPRRQAARSLPQTVRRRAAARSLPAANAPARLEHALAITDKLLAGQLSRADRQELERIKTSLTVLEVKGEHSHQESEVINSQFASLIKLMSKYGY